MLASTIAALRRLLPPAALRLPPPSREGAAGPDRCALCALPLDERQDGRHEHLLDLDTRRLHCACTACALLFDAGTGGGTGQHWRRLPRERKYLPGLTLAGAEWASLEIPIQLAFLTINSATGAVTAAYPSPAGAVMAEMDPGVWAALTARHPELRALRPDLEALLVDRMSAVPGCYIIPLDDGYRLTGQIRQAWTGFTGGPDVKRQLTAYTQALRTGQNHDG